MLDGQQRLTTLQSFYAGYYDDGKPFVLNEVAKELQGASYASLAVDSKRRLNNTFIQAVVIEPSGDEGRDSVYRLFGRLNSGGVSLTAQEVRVALYRGPMVELIRDLNHDASWRQLFGPAHKKLKDHELILRSLAMTAVVDDLSGRWDQDAARLAAYKPPMAQFLNTYLETRGELKDIDASKITAAFANACELLVAARGKDGLKFSGRLNAAHVDAVVGTLIHLFLRGVDVSPDALSDTLSSLSEDHDYTDWISRSTSHRDSVVGRLQSVYTRLMPGS